MIKVNLLREPAGAKKRRRTGQGISSANLIALGVAAVLLIAVFLWFYLLSSSVGELEVQAAELRAERDSLANVTQQLQAAQEQKRRLDERVAVIERLRDNQRGPVRLMNHVLDSLPTEPTLWLTSLAQQPGLVAIEGRAFDVPSIADFIARLEAGQLFREVELEYWEDQGDSIKFKINCRSKE
ncbi:MAG TPA: PilN domain-containing protein [Acidobacteriota bacterium]|nr:PilN domain-containing protein [Acidobacteriota bacterium]